jgi:hypothetical protein
MLMLTCHYKAVHGNVFVASYSNSAAPLGGSSPSVGVSGRIPEHSLAHSQSWRTCFWVLKNRTRDFCCAVGALGRILKHSQPSVQLDAAILGLDSSGPRESSHQTREILSCMRLSHESKLQRAICIG